jgi:hypothetical protein
MFLKSHCFNGILFLVCWTCVACISLKSKKRGLHYIRQNLAHFVGTLPQGYIRNVPLPRVPIQQSPTSQIHTIPDYYNLPYVVPTYATPRSIVENTACVFSLAWQAIAIYTSNNLLSNPHGNILAALVLSTVLSIFTHLMFT